MNSSLFGSNNSKIESLELDNNEEIDNESAIDTITPPITDPNVSFNDESNEIIQETANMIEQQIYTQDSNSSSERSVFEERLNDNIEVVNNQVEESSVNTNTIVDNNVIIDDNHEQFYRFKCTNCSSHRIRDCLYQTKEQERSGPAHFSQPR